VGPPTKIQTMQADARKGSYAMAEVACLGILVADVIARPVDEWPERGKLVLCDQTEMHSGGCAANTGIGLAKLGTEVAVLGKVGNDGFADFVISRLQSHGCDCSGIVRDPDASTSCTFVMVHSDGERSFIHNCGANGRLRPDDVNMDTIKAAKILHLAGHNLMPGFDGEPAGSVVKRAKELGITTCLDTMGAEGCYIRTADGDEVRLPIYEVDTVDATGAGDAFVAGFLRGVLEGWDVERTGRLANAVGALCCTGIGTTQGIRGWEETLEFMEQPR